MLFEIPSSSSILSKCAGPKAKEVLEEQVSRVNLCWWQRTDHLRAIAAEALATMSSQIIEGLPEKKTFALAALFRAIPTLGGIGRSHREESEVSHGQ